VKKLKSISLTFIITVLSIFCILHHLNDNTWESKTIKKAEANLLLVETVGTVKLLGLSEEVRKNPDVKLQIEEIEGETTLITAVAINLGDGYILMLRHCLGLDLQMENIVPLLVNEEYIEVPAIVSDITHYLELDGFKEELELLGTHEDIAVLYSDYVKYKLKHTIFPIKLEEDFDYGIGAKVLSIGFSHATLKNLKDGLISSISLPPELSTHFMLSTYVYPGDSGSPVIAYRNGSYRIIGIVTSIYAMNEEVGSSMAFAYRSDFVLKAIDYIKFKYNLIKGNAHEFN